MNFKIFTCRTFLLDTDGWRWRPWRPGHSLHLPPGMLSGLYKVADIPVKCQTLVPHAHKFTYYSLYMYRYINCMITVCLPPSTPSSSIYKQSYISSKHTTGTCNFSTCMFIYSKLTGSLIQMQISLCLLYTYNLCDEKFVTNSQFAFNELWLW